MSDITSRSDMTVDLINFIGNDDSVIRAAKVSTATDFTVDESSLADQLIIPSSERGGSDLPKLPSA